VIFLVTGGAVLAGAGLLCLVLLARHPVSRLPAWPAACLLIAWAVAELAARFGAGGTIQVELLAGASLVLLVLAAPWRGMGWPARVFLATIFLTSAVYISAIAIYTFSRPLPPLSITLSVLLLILEVAAILLSLTFAFEIVDATRQAGRGRHPSQPRERPPAPGLRPGACLQRAPRDAGGDPSEAVPARLPELPRAGGRQQHH